MQAFRLRLSAWLILVIGISISPICEGGWPPPEQPPEEARANAAIVWASIGEWSSALRSAKVSGSVLVTATDSRFGTSEYAVSWDAVFDDAIGGLRFEATKQDATPGARYIRLPDRTITFENTVTIAGPAYQIQGLPFLQLSDPRALPFAACSEAHMATVELKPTIDLYSANEALSECTIDEGGDYRLIVYMGQQKEIRRTLVFDSEQGLVPVEMRIDVLDVGKDTILQDSYATTTEWKSFDGVPLPTRVEMRSTYGSTNTAETRMEWTDVNVPLSAADFDLAALNVPQGTSVFDERLGKTIVSKYGIIPESPPLVGGTEPPAERSRAAVLVTLNVAAVAIVLGVIWFRRRSSRSVN